LSEKKSCLLLKLEENSNTDKVCMFSGINRQLGSLNLEEEKRLEKITFLRLFG
jgi:hypothetical protein